MTTIKVAVKGILLKNDKMLIVRRSAFETSGAGTWENVGGELEFGESLETALKREFHEEVNLSITVQKQLYSTTFFTKKDRQIVLLTYLCESQNDNILLSNDHDQFLWATKEELLKLLPDSIISDYKQYGVLDLL
ncbi:MAG: NUDIX domain-containing protein [Solibacillus sp.]|uniref:NUDIX hydrolase n=1 Tax=unclassified Solibacillus TaxID=2637870 RepID=UPI0030F9A7FB